MSIFTTLFTGSSGLEAHGNAIGVVGDNIANVSTVGFKETRAELSDIIAGNIASQTLGAGVRMSGVGTLFGQGQITSTGRNLDLAIKGNGFFVVNGNHDGIEGQYYSRDGRLQINKDNILQNVQGMNVQGYQIDAAGVQSPLLSNISLGGQSPPRASTGVNMSVNLDSSSIPPPPFVATNPAATSNFSTSVTVYDSLGTAHRADVYFRTAGGGAWEWHALVDGGELTGGVKGTPTEIARGTLAFTTAGALNSQATLFDNANFLNATPNQVITFNFGDPIATGGTGIAGTTQFAASSTVKGLSQDGFSAGFLSDVNVAQDGTLTGIFSNGVKRPVARIALASFASEEGLNRVGDQLFTQTPASGNALVAPAATGDRGSVLNGSLEGSNVDLGTELVHLIAFQRAFTANAKTVSTADEMLQEVANLKR